MVRLPDGVDGERFFEKRCPGHRPQWLETVPLDADSEVAAFPRASVPSLVWAANLAALELHTPQAQAGDPWPDCDGVRPRPRGPARAWAIVRACPSRCATSSISSGSARW